MNNEVDTRLSIKTNCLIQLRDKEGNLKDERLIHNTVTTAGKAGVADQLLASPSLDKIGWMAIGTGSPAANALGTEIERIAFDTLERALAVDTIETYFGPGVGTGAITEAGTFDIVTAESGNMWTSANFSVINKGASDSLQITWQISIT